MSLEFTDMIFSREDVEINDLSPDRKISKELDDLIDNLDGELTEISAKDVGYDYEGVDSPDFDAVGVSTEFTSPKKSERAKSAKLTAAYFEPFVLKMFAKGYGTKDIAKAVAASFDKSFLSNKKSYISKKIISIAKEKERFTEERSPLARQHSDVYLDRDPSTKIESSKVSPSLVKATKLYLRGLRKSGWLNSVRAKFEKGFPTEDSSKFLKDLNSVVSSRVKNYLDGSLVYASGSSLDRDSEYLPSKDVDAYVRANLQNEVVRESVFSDLSKLAAVSVGDLVRNYAAGDVKSTRLHDHDFEAANTAVASIFFDAVGTDVQELSDVLDKKARTKAFQASTERSKKAESDRDNKARKAQAVRVFMASLKESGTLSTLIGSLSTKHASVDIEKLNSLVSTKLAKSVSEYVNSGKFEVRGKDVVSSTKVISMATAALKDTHLSDRHYSNLSKIVSTVFNDVDEAIFKSANRTSRKENKDIGKLTTEAHVYLEDAIPDLEFDASVRSADNFKIDMDSPSLLDGNTASDTDIDEEFFV